MTDIYYRRESFIIVGRLYEVYNQLGTGFSEIVYKDAIEQEFKMHDIPFEREKEYCVKYKDVILKHKFYDDLVVMDKIILEIKTVEQLSDVHLNQCINYLKISGHKLAILANFKGEGLGYKRIVL